MPQIENLTHSMVADRVAAVAQAYAESPSPSVAGFSSVTFVGSGHIYKVTPGTSRSKATSVVDVVRAGIRPSLARMLPETVEDRALDDALWLTVQRRIPGSHPESISTELMRQLVEFVQNLHEVPVVQVLDEFEDSRVPGAQFWPTLAESADKFAAKIQQSSLTETDQSLVARAVTQVTRLSKKRLGDPPLLVLVHKDIYGENVLVDGSGRLSAVLDWDAAQMAPREWEYAILWQRFPLLWNSVAEALDLALDFDLFVACSLTQALRFWKSFPHQVDFVDRQVDAIARSLTLVDGSLPGFE